MQRLFIALLFGSLILGSCTCKKPSDIEDFLYQIPNATVTPIDSLDGYSKCYKILLRQRLDHFGKDTVTFQQRIYLSHKDFTKPTLIITKGYYANNNSITELAELLDVNQIIVEHRFFGKSKPDSMIWKYLNIKQAAEDHHVITQLFKKIYEKKWASSGISKGGQTALYYKYFYPEDVDAVVAYVAPLNFSKEDPRIFEFLNNVGTKECRKKIFKFQRLLLQNKEQLLPLFKQYALDNEMTFKMSFEEAFEYCVLELSFAFWQWGDLKCDEIPENNSDIHLLFNSFSKIGFSFFSEEGIEPVRPFFYQALTEIGFYTYDTKPFADLINKVHSPNFYHTLPQNIDTTYNYKSMKNVNNYLQNKGNNIIYIYGEYDPWSATAFDLIPNKTNALKIVKQRGNHSTRIGSFSKQEQQQILDSLNKWLSIK